MALRKVKSVESEYNQSARLQQKDAPSKFTPLRETKLMGGSITVEEACRKSEWVGDEQKPKNLEWMKELEEIKPSNSIATKKAALSIVNNKNGKRVKVATPILNALDSPNAVRFLVNDEKQEVYIVAAQADEVAHNLAGKPTKNTVYSAGLVERLTFLFELDYSSRTSHSIGTWTVIEEEGTKMICVQLLEEVEAERQEDLKEEQDTTTQFTELVSEQVSESSAS